MAATRPYGLCTCAPCGSECNPPSLHAAPVSTSSSAPPPTSAARRAAPRCCWGVQPGRASPRAATMRRRRQRLRLLQWAPSRRQCRHHPCARLRAGLGPRRACRELEESCAAVRTGGVTRWSSSSARLQQPHGSLSWSSMSQSVRWTGAWTVPELRELLWRGANSPQQMHKTGRRQCARKRVLPAADAPQVVWSKRRRSGHGGPTVGCPMYAMRFFVLLHGAQSSTSPSCPLVAHAVQEGRKHLGCGCVRADLCHRDGHRGNIHASGAVNTLIHYVTRTCFPPPPPWPVPGRPHHSCGACVHLGARLWRRPTCNALAFNKRPRDVTNPLHTQHASR